MHRLNRIVIYITLLVLVVVFLIPIYLMIITSIKPSQPIAVDDIWNFPDKIHWQNYLDVARNFGPRFRHSLYVAIGATLISAMLGSLNGYIFSKWRVPSGKIIFPLFLFAMFIPYQSIIIPLLRFMLEINLYGGLTGLILIQVVYSIPITTLIFYNFYLEIPNELLEAGFMDGTDFWSSYQYIVFPLSIPGFVVVIIWQFTQVWNEFLFSLTMTTTVNQTLTPALAQMAGGEAVKWNIPMAGAILVALPPFIVYILMGRYFVQGLLAGSIKG